MNVEDTFCTCTNKVFKHKLNYKKASNPSGLYNCYKEIISLGYRSNFCLRELLDFWDSRIPLKGHAELIN